MKGALDGVTVVDLSWVVSGPYCTMLLRDLGAEVIKIERPKLGDILRKTGPFWGGQIGSYFMSVNRGKKSVTLNLADERGRDIFLSLVKQADVIVENFVPGNAKRLKIDYPVLQEVNPRIIYAAISGFGQTGPYSSRRALDVIIQGMSGIMSITGEPGRPPVRSSIPLSDIVAGMFTATAILAALWERNISGQGQMIDMGMFDTQATFLEHAYADLWTTGKAPGPLGSRHPSAAPFQAFQTRDGYVVVAAVGTNPYIWPLFCAVTGLVDLIDDPRFQTPYLRAMHYDELEPILTPVMKTRPTQEWVEEFVAVGVPCGPVNTMDKLVSDPQIAHRGAIVEMDHPKLGPWKVVNSPFKMSRTPGGVQGLAPDLGEHTEEVLCERLGLTAQQVAELRGQGVV